MPPSLREALETATTEAETATAAAPVAATSEPAPPADPPAQSLAEASDASTAAPAATEAPAAAAAPEKPADPTDTVKPDAAKAAEEAKGHRIDRAPASWKQDAKGEWAALPLKTRQEIHRREIEINRALSQSAPDRQLADQYKQVVAPYMGMVKQRGLDPITATANLFEADMKLSTGPAQGRAAYLAELIIDYGIDVKELDTALSAKLNPATAAIVGAPAGTDIAAIVQQQLQQALAPIMQDREAAKMRSQQEVTQTVESMAVDPKYPMFDEVRTDMADLIDLFSRRGIYLSLDEAYNRAIRMNPDTYGQMERQSTVSSATQQHQAALKAKAAGSSISGAPAGGGGQFNGGDGSLRGAIEAAFGGQRL
jgi:hypothetical protein